MIRTSLQAPSLGGGLRSTQLIRPKAKNSGTTRSHKGSDLRSNTSRSTYRPFSTTTSAMSVKPDYDSYLSWESQHRARSQIKTLRPYFDTPGMISFGGGYPHPETWPVNAMALSIPFAEKTVFVPGWGVPSPDKMKPMEDFKALDKSNPLSTDLSTELQYGAGFGSKHFVDWLTEHIRRVHNPPYEDWQVLNTAGNTAAVDAILRSFCDRGDSILVEEFGYPGLLTNLTTQGVEAISVPMDGEGVLPKEMDKILNEWDDKKRGSRKPKFIVLVPTCSNPTGATIPVERKKEIYEVARKHGVIIVEDDPYCFLQIRPKGADQPIVPSFLSIDVDGRVLRIDSFSKIVSPGSRVGWVTGPKQLVDYVMTRTEAGTHCPSGFSVAALCSVLRAWGDHEGFEKQYLPHISNVYKERCLLIISLFEKYLPRSAVEWPQGTGGMFLWIRLKAETHPLIGQLTPEEVGERTFQQCIKEKVLLVPSTYFKSPGGPEWTKEEESKRIFLRLCFAMPPPAEMEEGVKRLATAIKREWQLE